MGSNVIGSYKQAIKKGDFSDEENIWRTETRRPFVKTITIVRLGNETKINNTQLRKLLKAIGIKHVSYNGADVKIRLNTLNDMVKLNKVLMVTNAYVVNEFPIM